MLAQRFGKTSLMILSVTSGR